MKQKHLTLLMAGVLLGGMSSCIDNNYDLSNINTESEFKVKDLVLPIQIDTVCLRDIITVNEGDKLDTVTINGKTFYAVSEAGDFSSDDIEINGFTAIPQKPNSTVATFTLDGSQAVKGKKRAPGDGKLYLLFDQVDSNFDYSASDIDGSIRVLDYLIFKPSTINITIKSSLSSSITATIENVNLRLPNGLDITSVQTSGKTYNANEIHYNAGRFTLPEVPFKNGEAKITINSNKLTNTNNWFRYDSEKKSGEFMIDDKISIEKGTKLALSASVQELASLPNTIEFEVSYDLGAMDVLEIMGEVQYELTGEKLKIDPIELNDLPDFLDGEETNLILANPQIYLSMNNPVGHYGLEYRSGMNIIAKREEKPEKSFPLNAFVVPSTGNGPYNFVLSPNEVTGTEVPEGFGGASWVQYNDLGNLLSGDGLPNIIDIELVDPMIPQRKLSSPLKLNSDLGGIAGKYQFLAPLALVGGDNGSKIYYEHTNDGWLDDDLRALTIEALSITANVKNEIPLNAELTIKPIGEDGQVMKDVQVSTIEIGAGESKAVEFKVTGTVKNLDGIRIIATVIPDGTEEALAPAQYIYLTNIRARATGNYTKEL